MLRSMRVYFSRLGLQRRIMLYVTAGLIVFSIIYSFVALQAIQQASALVFRERLLTALTAAGSMDDGLEHLEGELQDASLSVAPALARNDLNTAEISLHALHTHWTRFDAPSDPSRLTLVDGHGGLVWTEPADRAVASRPPLQVAYLREAFQSQEPTLTDGTSADGSGRDTLTLVMPVRGETQLLGYLVSELDRSLIGEWLESSLDVRASDGNRDSVALVDSTGGLIANLDRAEANHTAEHFQLIEPLWQAGQAGTRIHTMIVRGQDYSHVIAFAPLKRMPWGVLVEQEQDEALALPRRLQWQFVGFGISALLGGLLLAWLTTRTVVRPINALTHASREIARGQLEHPLDVSSMDEVGTLARSFDQMRVALKHSQAEIERWNRELETRVQQRTRELGALVESVQALTSTLDVNRLLDIIIHETREVLPASEGIAVFLAEPGTRDLLLRSWSGLTAHESGNVGPGAGPAIAAFTFAANSPTLLETQSEVKAVSSHGATANPGKIGPVSSQPQVQSALGVPLISKGARLGVLVLYNFTREGAFAQGDVPVLAALANAAAAAIENAALYAKVREKEAAHAQLLEKVIQAQEEERQRVAREIHDELGQFLTRLSINLKMCEADVAPHSTSAAQRLASSQTLVWQTIEQAHRMIVELRPTLLDELGLQAALREELAQRLAPLGIETTLAADGGLEHLPPTVGITVFRIVQEAITNIARHAHATHAGVELHAEGDALVVEIQDDGMGLAADATAARNGHRPFGLLGMQERAALLGGTLSIEPCVPHGTCLVLKVPLGSQK